MSEPLRKLTEKDAVFVWESQQQEAFEAIMISSAPVLKYYDVASETTIQCDASESGLGATLLQDGQPIAFASRSLSAVERQYAQIEKECLSIVFACSRFNQYIHGRDLTTVETDHKPLVPIFQKSLHSAPKRLQRMLLRLQRYNLHVKYLPGPQMFIADMLSRAYLQADHAQCKDTSEYQLFQLEQEEQLLQEIARLHAIIRGHLPADQAVYPCRYHIADFDEHSYDRMANFERRSSGLHSGILELQRRTDSARWSTV